MGIDGLIVYLLRLIFDKFLYNADILLKTKQRREDVTGFCNAELACLTRKPENGGEAPNQDRNNSVTQNCSFKLFKWTPAEALA